MDWDRKWREHEVPYIPIVSGKRTDLISDYGSPPRTPDVNKTRTPCSHLMITKPFSFSYFLTTTSSSSISQLVHSTCSFRTENSTQGLLAYGVSTAVLKAINSPLDGYIAIRGSREEN